MVPFDDTNCDMIFEDKVILQGHKDPATDLWILPITAAAMQTALPR
jgi:hypothetical protein